MNPNEELEEITFHALVKAREVLTDLELSALCALTGMDYKEIEDATSYRASEIHRIALPDDALHSRQR